MTTDRLDWTITNRGGLWWAYNESCEVMLTARTKSEIMICINRWEKVGE